MEDERIGEHAAMPLLRPATSLKRTIFQGALQFVESRTEDECREATRRIPFKQTFRNPGSQVGGRGRPRSIRFSCTASSSGFPLLFQLPALYLSSKCQLGPGPEFQKSKTARQNFLPPPRVHSGDDSRERDE